MANPKNTIALNGKIYDVTTGAIVKSLKNTKEAVRPSNIKPRVKSIASGHNIDGFTKPKEQTKHSQPKHHAKHHQKAKHAARHKPQHSKTLMRSGKAMASSALHASRIKKPAAEPKTDAERKERSTQVSKSGLISRFNSSESSPKVVKKVEPLTVKKQGDSKARPGKATSAHKSTVAAAPAKSADNMFARALEKAESHKQPAVKVKRSHFNKVKNMSKRSKVLLGVLIAVSIVGIGVWYYLPTLQVKIASVQAGFNASVPSYHPSGFSQAGVESKEGRVTLSYKSNSDNRNYKVEQSASNWDSESLLESYIKPNVKETPITYVDNGKTVYLYDGSNATWVSGGVWYKIEGQSSLNSDQLLRIANSL